MTIQEVSERYLIPMHILRDYERWGLGGPGKWAADGRQYDDSDLERLSTLVTLRHIGFSPEEAKEYMGLLVEGAGTAPRRLGLLEEKRAAILEGIHREERRLQRLDELRHQLRKKTQTAK